ncbi:DUF4241 domain-containing protein [Bacillus altitudinis]|uniref:DUF4241 domain-containing protein n=1 Tax=Bacillus altitudinis TaxID=293387 RepID=UPI0016438498|nr:DUF4241 domain-containing protein [Bacillus altitudinis]MDR7669005.1 DUF4241 domain-containing protein [Bacillus altitudinis]WGV00067.1 DUF4241 domain-containing protein [Bacillus altitudinis]
MYNINPTNLLYENGETTNRSEGNQLFAKQIGHIEITSDQIVACDPFVSEGDQSFTRKVAIGKYPILLLVKRLESEDERIAYAMIKFTKRASNRMGDCHKSRAGTQTFQEFYSYGINTGYGLFHGC